MSKRHFIIIVLTAAVLLCAGAGTCFGAELAAPELCVSEYVNQPGNTIDFKPLAGFQLDAVSMSGDDPTGVRFYRKLKGEKKYQVIATKKWDGDTTLRDTAVTPGKVYVYKARTYAEKDGTTYWSAWSKPYTGKAVNISGIYKVKSVTSAGKTKRFVLKFTSHKDNGDTRFWKDMPDLYQVKKPNGKKSTSYVLPESWSKDGKTWKKLPSSRKKGVSLKGGKSIYIRYAFVDQKHKNKVCKRYFGGAKAKKSEITAQYEDAANILYYGPAVCGGELIDLTRQKAVLWDRAD